MTESAGGGTGSADVGELADSLWSSLENLRLGTNLQWPEFSAPMLGIVFLRAVSQQFDRLGAKLNGGSSRNPIEPDDYRAQGVLFVPESAHFSAVSAVPEGGDLATALREAMSQLGGANPDLRGMLPKGYAAVPAKTLHEGLRRISPIDLSDEDYGALFADLLLRVAQEEGQDGGDLFVTALHIVDLMVAIVAPSEGRVFDPCSGSGGMFTGCLRHGGRELDRKRLGFYGQEKSSRNAALSVMNLAVHGGAGLIEVADSYTDDPHQSVGRFDYVLANPKFNDTAFDAGRVPVNERFPHGAPTTKANYLWLQMCHAALNASGRAGIVMPNSASDGSTKETAIRKAWVEDDAVEAVVAVGEKMFGSITNPATLWFFNRAKKAHQQEHVLFIDARDTFTVIDAAHRRWTPAQVEFLANIIRLWRAEVPEFDNGSQAMLDERFEHGEYCDVPGLCGVATLDAIADGGWSLNLGRYVAVPDEFGLESFSLEVPRLRSEFIELSASARHLETLVIDVLEGA